MVVNSERVLLIFAVGDDRHVAALWDGVHVTGYSRRPQDVDAARRYLIEVATGAEGESLPTYGDVAAVYGGIARAVGPVLNTIARDCEQANQPDLSALVVDRGSGLPGTFDGRPVEPGSPQESAWRAELDRIRRHDWGA